MGKTNKTKKIYPHNFLPLRKKNMLDSNSSDNMKLAIIGKLCKRTSKIIAFRYSEILVQFAGVFQLPQGLPNMKCSNGIISDNKYIFLVLKKSSVIENENRFFSNQITNMIIATTINNKNRNPIDMFIYFLRG